MLEVFFNPYPNAIEDVNEAIQRLCAVANDLKGINDSIGELGHTSGNGHDSIDCWTLTTNGDTGATYTIASLIPLLEKRDKDLVIWYLSRFNRGHKCKKADLDSCEECVLTHLGVPAPILGLAAQRAGMASTISDDEDWLGDFFTFNDMKTVVPNICGQDDNSFISTWIEEWKKANLTFEEVLLDDFDAIFCKGALNSFAGSTEKGSMLRAFKEAKKREYAVDNNLIKIVSDGKDNIKELRSYSDGERVFFDLQDNAPVIAGFYRKSEAIDQNKAIKNACKRMRLYKK